MEASASSGAASEGELPLAAPLSSPPPPPAPTVQCPWWPSRPIEVCLKGCLLIFRRWREPRSCYVVAPCVNYKSHSISLRREA
jgi:hypothetical protein